MSVKILALLLFSFSAWSAVTPATIWEMRVAGTTTSGGGFDSTIASAGTDMSIFDNKNAAACTSCQSATVNISTADAVTNNTTTVTSASGNFSAALIGNTIYLAGGGTTTGWYQVTAVGGSTSITVDRATGGAGGSSQTMNIGGAVGGGASLTTLEIATNGAQPGNILYVKAGAWVVTTTQTFSLTGTVTAPYVYIGYTTTRSDGGMTTVQTATNSVSIFNITGGHHKFNNFIAERTAGTTVKGFVITVGGAILRHTKALNTTSSGYEVGNASTNAVIFDSWATGVSGSGGYLVTSAGAESPVIIGATANANSVNGFVFAGSDGSRVICERCVSVNNTGSANGFNVSGTQTVVITNSVAYGNAAAGVAITSIGSLVLLNNIFYNNTTYGVNSAIDYTGGGGLTHMFDYNAFGANGTAPRLNVSAGAHAVSLAADPFVDCGNATPNCALDASGKTELQSFGFPGILQSGGTGYSSIGALEPNPASSGGQKGYVFLQ